jgi:hypothetical protein
VTCMAPDKESITPTNGNSNRENISMISLWSVLARIRGPCLRTLGTFNMHFRVEAGYCPL